jgi:hypothetical protein
LMSGIAAESSRGKWAHVLRRAAGYGIVRP